MANPHQAGIISVDYHDFHPTFAGPASILVSPAALDRAAIMAGDLNAFVSGAPLRVSVLAQQWRTAITRDSIQLPGGASPRWTRSMSYQRLERTEKGFMSGLLGGVISQLVAEKAFGVDYFGHIEYFPRAIRFRAGSTRRPDFLGIPTSPSGRAIVVESKGRSDSFRGDSASHPVSRAKEQAASVLSVTGCSQVLRYAQFTHFDRTTENLQVDLFDPPGPKDGARSGSNETTTPTIDLRDYYRGLVNAARVLDASRVVLAGIPYLMMRHDLLDLVVGIPESVFIAVTNDRPLPIGSAKLPPTDAYEVVNQAVLTTELMLPSVDDLERGSAELITDIGGDGVVVIGSYPTKRSP